jgi:hypothetical protein
MPTGRDRVPVERPGQAVSSRSEVDAFLDAVRNRPASGTGGRRGRLIFALDATGSRRPTWDRACHIQAEMFRETAALGGLDVQLVFYRGYKECKSSKWHSDPDALGRAMSGVVCLGGQTQIGRVLNHARAEAGRGKVDALIFVGDSFEEDIDEVCHAAGELGVLGVPVFAFHEGGDPIAASALRQVARLTRGAYCPFDAGSADRLKELLAAVAVYATGGRKALADHRGGRSEAVLLLTSQLGR